MRIAWFTPFSDRSAVGLVSRTVASHIARTEQVDLWVTESRETLACELPVVTYARATDVDPAALREYDAIVYNIGDSSPFHRELFDVSLEVPGIVVLHDHVMHHFFAQRLVYEKQTPAEYVSMLQQRYGEPGERFGRRSLEDPDAWLDPQVAGFPLFEPAIEGARGVVVHSRAGLALVRGTFPGPARRLNLPWVHDPGDEPRSPTPLAVPAGKLLLLSTGRVNANKQIHVVLEALAGSPLLRGLYEYVIVGEAPPSYAARLRRDIEELGLSPCVRLLGRLPDAEYAAWLCRADVCINLRWPAMEGASAALLEQMMHAKPVLVTDTGVYSELPSDCVVKVAPGARGALVGEALTRLAGNREWRQRLGAGARRYARTECSPQKYASELVAFATEVAGVEPLYRLMGRLAGRLAPLGIRGDDRIVQTLAREAYDLFGTAAGSPPTGEGGAGERDPER